MQRRILLIAVVFVAGFGIGYGITWLFVGSPERGQSVAERRADRERPDAQAVPAEADVANAQPPDAGSAAQVPDVPPDAGSPGDAAAAAQALVPDAAQVAAPDVPAPAAEVVAEVAAAPREIDRCLNKVCRVDFGGVSGGISVRKGKFEHGAEVVWERDFGRADKVGTLDSDRNVRVEVLGVGLTDGVPSAAYISRKLKRGTQTGVIALKIGDRRLSLVPLDD